VRATAHEDGDPPGKGGHCVGEWVPTPSQATTAPPHRGKLHPSDHGSAAPGPRPPRRSWWPSRR
jgi:hypothetical protein